ncbi:hypothetical protein BpHYR1_035683 [Brachionus plicatilis]|uniref:Uncharacterized protein n=1 Tax=Brachionus plicatilis TaxID=10195 RepID=A0A3M7QM85_BRAPC|nr:hypothetical protein BpHYR1_035683 [Brachionus plicatilis]
MIFEQEVPRSSRSDKTSIKILIKHSTWSGLRSVENICFKLVKSLEADAAAIVYLRIMIPECRVSQLFFFMAKNMFTMEHRRRVSWELMVNNFDKMPIV